MNLRSRRGRGFRGWEHSAALRYGVRVLGYRVRASGWYCRPGSRRINTAAHRVNERRTEGGTMHINNLTNQIIKAAMRVHSRLGPGMLESSYEACLMYELRKTGFRAESQAGVPLVYQDVKPELGYRIDLLVEKSSSRSRLRPPSSRSMSLSCYHICGSVERKLDYSSTLTRLVSRMASSVSSTTTHPEVTICLVLFNQSRNSSLCASLLLWVPLC